MIIIPSDKQLEENFAHYKEKQNDDKKYILVTNSQEYKSILDLMFENLEFLKTDEVSSETEEPDLTADWKIYTNEEYNFQFNYLKGWNVSGSKIKSGDYFINIDNPEISSGDTEIYLRIIENASLNDILEEEKDLGCHDVQSGDEIITKCSYCEVKTENILIDKYTAQKLTKISRRTECQERGNCEDKCIDYGVKTIVFERDNDVYILNTSGGDESLENFNKIYKSISF